MIPNPPFKSSFNVSLGLFLSKIWTTTAPYYELHFKRNMMVGMEIHKEMVVERELVGVRRNFNTIVGFGGDWGWLWTWGGSLNQAFFYWSWPGGASSWRRGTKTSKFWITRSAIHRTIFDATLSHARLGEQQRGPMHHGFQQILHFNAWKRKL